jgi:hypothetical protein
LTNLHHQPKETSLFDKPSLSSEGDQSIRQTFAIFRKRTVYSTNLRHLQKETSLFDKLSPYSEGEQSIRQTFAIFRRRPVYSTNLRPIQKENSLFDKPSPSSEGEHESKTTRVSGDFCSCIPSHFLDLVGAFTRYPLEDTSPALWTWYGTVIQSFFPNAYLPSARSTLLASPRSAL